MAGRAAPRLGQFRALGLKYRLSVLEAHLSAAEAWHRQSLARVQDFRAKLADSTRQIDDSLGDQPTRPGYERVGQGDYRGAPSRRRGDARARPRGDQREADDEDRDEDRDEDGDVNRDENGRSDSQQDEQRAESTTRRSTARTRRPRS